MHKICTIAIPVWNKLEVTRQCLNSLVSNTKYPHKVLIIDNGSDEETKSFLKDFCESHDNFGLKRFEDNIGYLNAVNFALSTVATPYICLLNNDTILTDGWLSECISILKSRKDIGIACPTTNEISKRFERIYQSGKLSRYKGQFIEVNSCIGSCFIVRKEVINAIGTFDPIYTNGYFEEVDYCFRAKERGFYSIMALGAYITHLSSVSFKEIPEEQRILWHKNRDIFESRWGRSDRILFFIRGKYDDAILSRAKKDLLERCRNRAIIDFYFKHDSKWINNVHFNIREKHNLFYNSLILFLMLKFKKKPYNIVITDIKIPSLLSNALKSKQEFLDFKEISKK